MNFVTDYLHTLDYVAIAALVVFAVVGFWRRETVWTGLLLAVVVIWAVWRFVL
jgi:hypothetical protein